MPTDDALMRRALVLAVRGRGWVNPNPMVGAVVVKDGAVVAEGYHARVGGPHAEVVALEGAGEAAKGSTLYVSLEPCNHHGRTPPCTAAILKHGVTRVVYACDDENALTAGQARAVLEAAGVVVVSGVEAAAARELNRPFLKYARTGVPYVLCKMAMSLDGKIATRSGKSRWISGPEARERVQEWRGTYAAVMVGVGTVLADDPALTCKLPGAHQPLRVVVDPMGATPEASRVLQGPGETIVAVGPDVPEERLSRLREAGASIVVCPQKRSADGTPGESFRTSECTADGEQAESSGRTGAESTVGASGSLIGKSDRNIQGVDLTFLLGEISQRGVSSILAEGGGGLNAALLSQGLVDRVAFFVAPILLGGREARTPVEGPGAYDLPEAIQVRDLRATRVGADLLLEGEIGMA